MSLNLLEPTPLPPTIHARRVHMGSPVYNEIFEFLVDEAELLDTLKLAEWSELLAPDIEYNVPQRLTRPVRQQDGTTIRTVQHMHDNLGSLMLRVRRITDTRSAWGEDPPSRTRRMVSNVRVYGTEKPDEYKVLSYLLVSRSRFDFDYFDLIPCDRHDVLRKDGDSFKIARREILIDQSVIGTPNLGIFL
ncbi:aromatic-ring-hydroxylating dioxygenase subunit beta [Paraburkholderia dinghuensis]|uniref:3-phenylpropionate/cinnamic acid dioxygenase subunit beta n=1 Tax=Paraburkholderia dinghuensis TaxID=2305225 RepID=A0A3N6PXZ4_9BURK|nr:3-phenylpropionate/cinnamic acid dioxygenase subunit beta [Paraburkholderia dinghuensis]RQH04896.1 3-phenylpropionate/cinnamic acid dioxygenase subunit beta [Paraburkholderia dinghuensis]